MKKSYKKRSRKRSTKKRARRRTKKAGDYSKLAKIVMDTKIQKKLKNYDKNRNTYRQLGLTDSQKKKLDEMIKQKKIDKAQKELAKDELSLLKVLMPTNGRNTYNIKEVLLSKNLLINNMV